MSLPEILFQRQISSGPGPCLRYQDPASLDKHLEEWQEADSLKHCQAEYAQFQPGPRSTIALCYNCNGELLASTHGDHTVKLTNCLTRKLSRILTGHRRTPWVVRFHPQKPHLLASGSLDHEVRLWDATTGECLASHIFGKPIASLAFHMSTDVLAVACGHKLYMWEHASGKGPVIVLKTLRSMRAVHFHPHGLPLVLTAEVQDPSDTAQLPCTMTENGPFIAERPEGSHATTNPNDKPTTSSEFSNLKRKSHSSPKLQDRRPDLPQAGFGSSALDGWIWQDANRSTQQPRNSNMPAAVTGDVATQQQPLPQWDNGMQLPARGTAIAGQHASPFQAASTSQPHANPLAGIVGMVADANWSLRVGNLPPSMVNVGNELPFPGGAYGVQPAAGGQAPPNNNNQAMNQLAMWNPQLMAAFSAAAWNILGEEQPPRVRLRLWKFNVAKPVSPFDASTDIRMQLSDAVLCSEMGVHFSPCGRYLAATVACRTHVGNDMSAAALWGTANADGAAPSTSADVAEGIPISHQGLQPGFPLGSGLARTGAFGSSTIPASELRSVQDQRLQQGSASQLMPAWSAPPLPVAALTSVVPPTWAGHNVDNNNQQQQDGMLEDDQEQQNTHGREHAMSDQQEMQDQPPPEGGRPERVAYEVRVFSIDGDSFGQVTRARRIRAAHCLTSVQFSPTSDHMLLAYGKKHVSLLRSLVAENNMSAMTALHTILEVFRISDMEVVRVLPSAEDEINAACFHPAPGGGIAYGTKEGRLRIISQGIRDSDVEITFDSSSRAPVPMEIAS